ncbi:DUF1761 domain-containing protein [Candidatus Woesearchaeota archaeon]|nr:DUF1761 domain-containing protein [Candidatus Woesearchaeota archaeon]
MANVNLLAVLVSAVASMVLGFLWYGPLFGKAWMRLSGKPAKSKAKTQGMGLKYLLGFIASLVMAYVLAILIQQAGAGMLSAGVKVGALAWLGFLATNELGTYLWDNKPFTLYLVNAGYWLATLLVMAAILTVWM